MKELEEFCRNLKKDFTPKIKDPTKPVSCWSEKDILNKKVVDAFVIIFRTRGCSWALNSGCSMCGYFNDSLWEKTSDEDFIKQFETVMKKYSNEKFIKIFTSGSFLDDNEVKPSVRKKILTTLFETAEKVSVESRPEYITTKTLIEIKKISKLKIFEVGIGLETADDKIRDQSINKGFGYKNYKNAAEVIKKHGFKLKTYVIIKPPFLTEKESIEDCLQTVEKIKDITDIISFNPTNIQRNTLVDFLWYRKQFRPARLWSIVEILKQSKKISKNVRIKCDIVAGGSIRGAHNCKTCDHKILKAINDFSLNQDTKVFANLNCDCNEKWQDVLDIEKLGFGSMLDI